MRVPRMVKDFIEWRWAPCVALISGSLAFVVLALLLVPTDIAGTQMSPRSSEASNGFGRVSAPSQRALLGASIARSMPETDPMGVAAPSPAATPARFDPAASRRGFAPIIERAEPPPVSTDVQPPGAMPQQPPGGGAGREIVVQ